MGKYQVSRQAERTLSRIHAESEDLFGRYQADAYFAGFEHIFELLSDFPLMGQSADFLVPNLRRFRFQSHYIFYMPETDHIFIRDIFHIRMNVRRELFE